MFHFGDILKWKDDPAFEPEPTGRFMYVAEDPMGTVFARVICVSAAPDTDWLGTKEPIPVDERQLELADD